MMDINSINKEYIIEVEVLTPVHVGAGSEKDWMENVDFVYDDKSVYLLDQHTVIQNIGIDKYNQALLSGQRGSIKRQLSGKLNDFSKKIFAFNVFSSNPIKAQLHSGLNNNPIIPGSSLKGALRSIIINSFEPSKSIDNKELNDIMGSSTRGDEFGRFFKVNDLAFSRTDLFNTKIWNLTGQQNNFQSGWKHAFRNGTSPNFKDTGFNTVYECILPHEKAFFKLMLAELPFKNLKHSRLYDSQQELNKKEGIITGNVNDLFQKINTYTQSYLKKEIEFFKKYPQAENTEKIIKSLEKLQSEIPKDNKYCIMRLAAGSGFHGITGDWQFETHDIDKLYKIKYIRGKEENIPRGVYKEKDSAKSRKIAIKDGNYLPMGFIKLRSLSKEEIQKREQEQAEQAEQEHREQLERARIKKEEAKKLQLYNALINEFRKFFDNGEYEKAMEQLVAMKELSINPEDIVKRENEVKYAIELKAQRKKEEAEKQRYAEILKQKKRDEQIRQEENKRIKYQENEELKKDGLKILDNYDDYDKGRQKIEEFYKLNNESIPGEEYPELIKFIKRMALGQPKKWKKFKKGNWNLVIKWLGYEEARKLFESLQK